jgi:hypothetical protein
LFYRGALKIMVKKWKNKAAKQKAWRIAHGQDKERGRPRILNDDERKVFMDRIEMDVERGIFRSLDWMRKEVLLIIILSITELLLGSQICV